MLGILKHPSFSQLKTEKTFCYIYIFYFIIDLRMCSAWWMWKHVKLSFVLFLTTWKSVKSEQQGSWNKKCWFLFADKEWIFFCEFTLYLVVSYLKDKLAYRTGFFSPAYWIYIFADLSKKSTFDFVTSFLETSLLMKW